MELVFVIPPNSASKWSVGDLAFEISRLTLTLVCKSSFTFTALTGYGNLNDQVEVYIVTHRNFSQLEIGYQQNLI